MYSKLGKGTWNSNKLNPGIAKGSFIHNYNPSYSCLVTAAHTMLILFVLWLLVLRCQGDYDYVNVHHHTGPQRNSRNTALHEATRFLHAIQNPLNCSGHTYVHITIGIGGGFAAQFQLVASEMMRVLAATDFRYPVVITGGLVGYSAGKECDYVNHEWTCFFEPTSTCHNELLKTGKKIDWPSFNKADEETIPKAFKHLGLAFWWGSIQHYLFRFKASVEKQILLKAHEMLDGKGFPFGLPVAGMHVRHGDKHTDGFTEHSLSEELDVVRKSPDCHIQNSMKSCFTVVNFSDPTSSLWVSRAMKGLTTILNVKDIDRYNASKGVHHPLNMVYATEPKVLLPFLHFPLPHTLQIPNLHHFRHVNTSMNHMDKRHHTQPHTLPAAAGGGAKNETLQQYVIPLSIFVASDDPEVIVLAKSLGFLVDPSGVSQKTASVGMLSTLVKHPEYGYNATLEIITDIFFLSQSSSLSGVCGSQVYRMAVALSNVTGSLHFAKAMDTNQINQVKKMSNKYRIPFPENFR